MVPIHDGGAADHRTCGPPLTAIDRLLRELEIALDDAIEPGERSWFLRHELERRTEVIERAIVERRDQPIIVERVEARIEQRVETAIVDRWRPWRRCRRWRRGLRCCGGRRRCMTPRERKQRDAQRG